MASAVVIDNTGKIVRSLAQSIRLEEIPLALNEVLSWENNFRSTYPNFDWKDRIMHYGDAVAFVDCTKGCKISIDHIDVRIEGTNPADVCALIHEVNSLLGGLNVHCTPIRSRWSRLVAWAKAFIDKHAPGYDANFT